MDKELVEAIVQDCLRQRELKQKDATADSCRIQQLEEKVRQVEQQVLALQSETQEKVIERRTQVIESKMNMEFTTVRQSIAVLEDSVTRIQSFILPDMKCKLKNELTIELQSMLREKLGKTLEEIDVKTRIAALQSIEDVLPQMVNDKVQEVSATQSVLHAQNIEEMNKYNEQLQQIQQQFQCQLDQFQKENRKVMQEVVQSVASLADQHTKLAQQCDSLVGDFAKFQSVSQSFKKQINNLQQHQTQDQTTLCEVKSKYEDQKESAVKLAGAMEAATVRFCDDITNIKASFDQITAQIEFQKKEIHQVKDQIEKYCSMVWEFMALNLKKGQDCNQNFQLHP
eukprot:TRINITY_DN17345_c0_g1_i2.p1 TRINITY_DN17345_c0_g1~~TRINITY_DN17345_c0_g1_i2.p1  ORF type:complete len:341 (-),score=27.89 TRINITY_DN17345_c0_g1_i2:13-1035(-)